MTTRFCTSPQLLWTISLEPLKQSLVPQQRHMARPMNFLDMQIEFVPDKKVHISMKNYIEKAIWDCNLDICFEAPTSAMQSLFKINKTSPLLSCENADSFCRIMSKLVYVTLCGQPNLLLAVCFLTTRLTKAIQQLKANWSKSWKMSKEPLTWHSLLVPILSTLCTHSLMCHLLFMVTCWA